MPREVSAGAIIYLVEDHSLRYLLLHYEAGHWDFPKGNIEEGESEIDTVRREVKEETGIGNISIMDGFRRKIRYFYRRQRKTVLKEVIFYLARSYTDKIHLSYEHIGYKWLTYNEALGILTFKNSRILLRTAQEYLSAHPEQFTPTPQREIHTSNSHLITSGKDPSAEGLSSHSHRFNTLMGL